MTTRRVRGTIARVDWMIILGWLPLAAGIVAASMLLAYQLELPALALFALLGGLAIAHVMDPPVPPHATPELLRDPTVLWPMASRLGVELMALAAVISLWRNLLERDEVEAVQWDDMEAVRQLAEFFESSPLKPEDRRQRMFELGFRLLDLEVGLLSRIERDRHRILDLHLATEELELAVGDEAPLETTPCHGVIATERTLALEDTRQRNHESRHPFGAYLGAPVRVHGELFGTLVFASRAPRIRRFRSVEKHLIALMAGWLGCDLERDEAKPEGLAALVTEPESSDASEVVPIERIPCTEVKAAKAARRPAGSAWAPRSVEPNTSIRKLAKRLQAGLGPVHSLAFDLCSETPRVGISRPLFVRVLFGLVANGLEALPGGGELVVETRRLVAGDPGSDGCAYATVSVRARQAHLDGARLIERMESDPERRDDAIPYRRIRNLLARVDGDHSVHCEANGDVVLTIYLPEIEHGPSWAENG